MMKNERISGQDDLVFSKTSRPFTRRLSNFDICIRVLQRAIELPHPETLIETLIYRHTVCLEDTRAGLDLSHFVRLSILTEYTQ